MFVEIFIEPTYPVLPKAGESQVRIFNGRNCAYNIGIGFGIPNFELQPGMVHTEHVGITGDSTTFSITATVLPSSPSGCSGFTETGRLESKKANSFFLTNSGTSPTISPYEDDPDKSRQGRPVVRVLASVLGNREFKLTEKKSKEEFIFESSNRNLTDIVTGEYEVTLNNVKLGGDIEMKLGGVYALILIEKSSNDYVRLRINYFVLIIIRNYF